MTREFLKNLGLEDAAVDKILDENILDYPEFQDNGHYPEEKNIPKF